MVICLKAVDGSMDAHSFFYRNSDEPVRFSKTKPAISRFHELQESICEVLGKIMKLNHRYQIVDVCLERPPPDRKLRILGIRPSAGPSGVAVPIEKRNHFIRVILHAIGVIKG